MSHPPKRGPLTSHFFRLPSEVKIKAPLRVPTRTRTLLIGFLLEWFFCAMIRNESKVNNEDTYSDRFPGRMDIRWVGDEGWRSISKPRTKRSGVSGRRCNVCRLLRCASCAAQNGRPGPDRLTSCSPLPPPLSYSPGPCHI